MTQSCALDTFFAMCLVQLTLEAGPSKTESQQREELHIRTLHWATRCSSSVSVSLEQSINDGFFSTETKNKCSFTSDKAYFLDHICAKKLQKLIEKHDVR